MSNPFNKLFGQSNQPQQTTQQPTYSPFHQSPPTYQSPPNPYQSASHNTNQYIGNNHYQNNQEQHNFGGHHMNSFMHHHQPNNQQNNSGGFSEYDTSINIENLSPKQLLCECIDLSTGVLKQIVDVFTKNNDLTCPYEGKKVIDFSLLANYILDPARLDKILTQFLAQDEQSIKALVKSWIFELKYIRNLWAHSQKINYRLAFRGFDTLGLLFDSFGGDKNSALFHKIETYRKALLIAQVKEGVF